MSLARTTLPAAISVALAATGVVLAECPEPDEVVRRIGLLALDKSSRVARFEGETPEPLYRKAAKKLERPMVDRVEKKGYGVMVTELPLAQWWQAINDENRHQGYVPVGHSEILGGTVRGADRVLFQYAKMFGMGRWWLSRIRMNGELYRATNGALWEFWWEEDLDAFDRDRAPVSEVSDDLPPLEMTRGSWLLASLGDDCTLVELFSWSRAGGAVGALEGVATTRSLKSTLNGMNRLASELESEFPAVDPPFVRPDGTPLPEPQPVRAAE